MNQLIATRGKEIIIALLVVIAAEFLFIIKSGNDNNNLPAPPFDPRIPDAALKNFIDTLFNPSENVHGVVLIAPGRDRELKVLSSRLQPANACDSGNIPAVTTVTKGQDIPPPECLGNGKISVDLESQRIFTITPAINTSAGNKSIVLFHDADPRWVPICGQGTTKC